MSKEKIVSAFYKAKNGVVKHSPEILIGAGIFGLVVGAVWACKETIAVNDILKSTSEDLDKIKTEVKDEKEAKKQKTKVYVKAAGKVVRRYSGPVIVSAVSITAIIASHDISLKRFKNLGAAYATLEATHNAYRRNVIEQEGEEADYRYRHGIKQVDVKDIVVDENGKSKTVKKKIDVVDHEEYSDYARFFDEANPYWQKDSELNYMFLRAQQSYFNDKLRVEKIVFLNDVYKALGFPLTKAGQVVGWVYDPSRSDIDSYIDFGIRDIYRPSVRDFVNGYERAVILDFNVDGNVWKDM